jgi:nicotinamide phosphoribosyltransferase
MGGALLQKLDRDTQKFAFKCSYAEISGKGIDVQKHPVEIDHHGVMRQSFKKSKAGKLKLIQTAEGYKTVKVNEMPEYKDQLVTVFENGKIIQEEAFEAIRNRLAVCKKEEFCLK